MEPIWSKYGVLSCPRVKSAQQLLKKVPLLISFAGPITWVQDRAWDPISADFPGSWGANRRFLGYRRQSAPSRLFRNRLHRNFVWKRVAHASALWKLQKHQQSSSKTHKTPKVHPPRPHPDRFEQSVPLFTTEPTQKIFGKYQLRCNIILAPILRSVFTHGCSPELLKPFLGFLSRAAEPFLRTSVCLLSAGLIPLTLCVCPYRNRTAL